MNDWLHCTRSNPCPICQKPDWCCIGQRFVNCMRIASEHPCKNGGWLHSTGSTMELRPLPRRPGRVAKIDAPSLMQGFDRETTVGMIEQLAFELGVSADSLEAIGAAWAFGHGAWAYPMRDWRGSIIGVRLRDHNGHKWAITGSHAGLFYGEDKAHTVYICEGPTDTAAAMTIGLCAIGRPSCRGCEEEVDKLIHRKGARVAVILADNDGPGYDGAQKLQTMLSVPSVIMVPPAKDIREFVHLGGTKKVIESLARSLVWTQPKTKEP